jgi:hypothetical protein
VDVKVLDRAFFGYRGQEDAGQSVELEFRFRKDVLKSQGAGGTRAISELFGLRKFPRK